MNFAEKAPIPFPTRDSRLQGELQTATTLELAFPVKKGQTFWISFGYRRTTLAGTNPPQLLNVRALYAEDANPPVESDGSVLCMPTGTHRFIALQTIERLQLTTPNADMWMTIWRDGEC